MTWPAILALGMIAVCLVSPSPVPLLYLSFILSAVTTLSLNPSEGGINILPGSVCAAFLVCKIVLVPDRFPKAVNAALEPGKLSILFVFLAYAMFTAYVLPRLFAHLVEVVPINAESNWPVSLKPISANYSQSAYLALSAGVVLAFFLKGENPSFRRHFLNAALTGGLSLIAAGIADFALTNSGHGDLLEPFRNAKYALLTNAEIAGDKRIVGLMPEASAYGSACVIAIAVLAFLRPCFDNRWLRDFFAPSVIAGLVAMAAASLSSTAYGGLGIFAAVFAVNWMRRVLNADAPARGALKWEAIVALTALVLLLAVLALASDLMTPVYGRLDALIFKKSQSSSFEDRARFTKIAMDAFFATRGLGVGLGSVMTSNWFVAILSSTGVFGAALLFGFILRLYVLRCPSPDSQTKEFAIALKFALVPYFAMMAVAGLTPDIGFEAAAVMGLLASLTSAKKKSIYCRRNRKRPPPKGDKPSRPFMI
jgi:hypothetical protein